MTQTFQRRWILATGVAGMMGILDGGVANARPTSSRPATGHEFSLEVHGACLYYRVQGHGPVLLVIQGGSADADGSDGLVAQLTDRYTVVTYDRRGLSRSKMLRSAMHPHTHAMTRHAADAAAILRAVTDRPAAVVGASYGAVIGLELLLSAPGLVGRLIAHEPPLTAVLPTLDRRRWDRFHHEVIATYRSRGASTAMEQLSAELQIDFSDRESDLPPPRPSQWQQQNTNFFLENDLPALLRYRPRPERFRRHAAVIVPAAGATSSAIYPHHCARRLAETSTARLVEFPSGHAGLTTYPKASAALIDRLMA